MQVRFYGKFADMISNQVSLRVTAPCTVADLRRRLAETYPSAGAALESPRVRACVDDQIVPDGHLLDPEGQVEILAPVSGG